MNVEEAGRHVAQRQIAQDPVRPAQKGKIEEEDRRQKKCLRQSYLLMVLTSLKGIVS